MTNGIRESKRDPGRHASSPRTLGFQPPFVIRHSSFGFRNWRKAGEGIPCKEGTQELRREDEVLCNSSVPEFLLQERGGPGAHPVFCAPAAPGFARWGCAACSPDFPSRALSAGRNEAPAVAFGAPTRRTVNWAARSAAPPGQSSSTAARIWDAPAGQGDPFQGWRTVMRACSFAASNVLP